MNRHVPPHDLESHAVPASRDVASFSARAAPDFRRAQRHSTRVRVIRRLLPLAVLAAVIMLGAGAVLARFRAGIDLPFDIGHLTLSGSKLTMEMPKLSGFTDDNRGYRVTANSATQDLTRPDMIDLTDIDAHLEMADKGWANVIAKVGSFDTKRQIITLGDGVDLAMRGGYGGHLKDAEIDVKAGSITTLKPVVFTYLDGKLVADQLTVTDRGGKALFEGNVQLDFRIANLPGARKDEAGPAPAPAGASR